MKKVLLFLTVAFLFVISAQAQITKGNVLLGGGISGFTQKNDDTDDAKSRGITIAPSVGFVTKTNTVIGFNAGYGRGKTKYGNIAEDFKSSAYSAGIFFRQYLVLGKSFYLFGEGGINYYRSKSDQYSGTNSRTMIKQSGAGIYIYPGIAYAVSKRFHLEASINNLVSLNYSKSEQEQTFPGGSRLSSYKNMAFNTNVSSSAPVSLGFRFVLGK